MSKQQTFSVRTAGVSTENETEHQW